jgi:hypothetical protein
VSDLDEAGFHSAFRFSDYPCEDKGRCEANRNLLQSQIADPKSKMQYPRRESNPHLRFRKPPFYPLNYGDDDLERINGLNEDGQDTVAVRGDFSRASFALDRRQIYCEYLLLRVSM